MDTWTVLISALALLFYLGASINVAVNRRRHAVPPPAMQGHHKVECALRVQGNTLEWLVIFLPSLWMFGLYHDPRVGAAIGAVWIAGRIIYLAGYMAAPSKRGPGFGIQALATLALLIGSVAGAIGRMI